MRVAHQGPTDPSECGGAPWRAGGGAAQHQEGPRGPRFYLLVCSAKHLIIRAPVHFRVLGGAKLLLLLEV